jgi:hypothetical protein
MALTILEAARIAANNGEDKKAGVLMTFAETSPLLAAMPIVSIAGNSYAYTRESVLPGIAFRAVNAAYTESAGATAQLSEPLKLIGGDLDVDKFLVQTNGAQIRSVHERMKATALAQQIGLKMIKGDATNSTLEFNGLEARYGGTGTTVVTGAQVVDNPVGGSSSALSMKALDDVIDRVDTAIGQKALIMSKAMARNMLAFLRSSSTAVTMSVNEFGQRITSYYGMPILIADQNGDQAAIATGDDGSGLESIYCVALGPSGLHMIQSGGIEVRDLGEVHTAPVYRTRVEWYCGLVDEHPRCVARLADVSSTQTAIA